MKHNKSSRPGVNYAAEEDALRKAAKLPPAKKSGKERHHIYSELEEEEDDMQLDYRQRESVFDYFDDGEDDA